MEVYRDVWTTFFMPTAPVQRLIDEYTLKLGLEPGRYTALHVRSMYTSNKGGRKDAVKNPIHCALQLHPGQPVYVATDNLNTTKAALEYGTELMTAVYGNLSGPSFVARLDEKEPLHLDRGSNFLTRANPDWMDHPPSDFYDIFVDLYLLGGASCVAFGVGGFGRWGSALSRNQSCHCNYMKRSCPSPLVAREGINEIMSNLTTNSTTAT
jgi:hypothetical protein